MAAPGMAAAATAHLISGGRGIASAQQMPVETTNYSSQTGVNDNSIVRYEDEGDLNPDGQRRSFSQRDTQTPFMTRKSLAYAASTLDQTAVDPTATMGFSDLLARGIGGYMRTQSLVQTDHTPVGSSINQLS